MLLATLCGVGLLCSLSHGLECGVPSKPRPSPSYMRSMAEFMETCSAETNKKAMYHHQLWLGLQQMCGLFRVPVFVVSVQQQMMTHDSVGVIYDNYA